MEFLLVVVGLAFLVFPLWAIVRILSLGRQNDALAQKLLEIESEVEQLRQVVRAKLRPVQEPTPAASPSPATTSAATPAQPAPATAPAMSIPPASLSTATPAPAPVPDAATPAPTETAPPAAAEIPVPVGTDLPPFIAPRLEEPRDEPPAPPTPSSPAFAPEPTPSLLERVNWEQFMGAKLFAWLGGLAAFLGAAFFVKYSFEHDLIPAQVRVAIGFVFALGLIVGGLKIPRERYAVTAQTLIATGIVSLYAVTFACNSIYHFAFFGSFATFLVMTLITGTAFLLAVRLDARVIAILGILGGFLTPVLLSTGQDNPGGLFGYLALLNLGLIAVALHRRWHFLVPLGAFGTILMQIGWAAKFFTDEKAGIAVIVCLGFAALFVGACAAARRRGGSSRELRGSATALACVCFAFALYFNFYSGLRARPGLLFGFALLADFCLFGLAWLERRPALVAIAAGGAIAVELAWAAGTLTVGNAPTAMLICLVFCAVFLGAYFAARRYRPLEADAKTGPLVPREIAFSAIAMPFVAFVLAFVFINTPAVAARPGLLFGFVLLADAVLLILAWRDERLPKLHLVAGVAVFALMAAWTSIALTPPLLSWALAFYLAYAVLHSAYPIVLERVRPAAAPTAWSQLFPPLSLLLMLGPLFKLDALSMLFWPCVLLVDAIAIALAFFTASLAAVAMVLVLTLGVTGVWLFRVPVSTGAQTELLLVVGGFALLFFAASAFLGRRFTRLTADASDGLSRLFGDTRAQLPAFSALLPFLLLILMTQRLSLANPSPVFGLALLLVGLVLGLAVVMTLEWLPACALAGVAGLEYAWHFRHFDPASATTPLAWYVGFAAVFAAYPFAFRRRFAALSGPWAVGALSGVLAFPLVYRLIQAAWPNDYLGVVPALCAVPPLVSLGAILRLPVASERARLNQLACYGGVALLFITLIFPIQFERQWLTLGWALEGAALLWLFHRVPHQGLRVTGVALLLTAFARLALNPAVLSYHARSGTPILNWYLYSYGIVMLALFVGARLSAPPRDQLLGSSVPRILNTLGVIMAFLLLNLEIADFFSRPGTSVLTFQFSGNFARDMSYTIAWALFALGLLLVSIWRRQRAGRYAALGLLGVAVLKLFFHDLARLDSLYRIGALFGVAIVAIVASYAYQRFLPSHDSASRDR